MRGLLVPLSVSVVAGIVFAGFGWYEYRAGKEALVAHERGQLRASRDQEIRSQGGVSGDVEKVWRDNDERQLSQDTSRSTTSAFFQWQTGGLVAVGGALPILCFLLIMRRVDDISQLTVAAITVGTGMVVSAFFQLFWYDQRAGVTFGNLVRSPSLRSPDTGPAILFVLVFAVVCGCVGTGITKNYTIAGRHEVQRERHSRWANTILRCSSCGTRYTQGRNSRCPACGSDVVFR